MRPQPPTTRSYDLVQEAEEQKLKRPDPVIKFHPYADIFPLMTGKDYDDLVTDLEQNGLREPIVLYEKQVLDGRNRLIAATEAQIKYTTEDYKGKDPIGFVISKNLRRRHLDASDRAELGRKLETLRHGGNRKGQDAAEHLDRKAIARQVDVGTRLIADAKLVHDKGTAELKQRREQHDLTMTEAARIAKLPPEQQDQITHLPKEKLRGAVKKVRRAAREKDLGESTRTASKKLGTEVFGVIYADPPWRFEPYSRETGMDRAADNHYPTMTIDEIAALKWPAAPDCALFMWIPVSLLDQGIDLLKRLGFAYKTSYFWCKPGHGTGYWSMEDQVEVLLLGVKGEVPAPAPGTQPPQYQTFPRGKHSAKPQAFAQMIKTMFPTTPRIEMFSRGGGPGWEHWGNEATAEAAD